MDRELSVHIDENLVRVAQQLIQKYLPTDLALDAKIVHELSKYCVALLNINEKVNLTGAKTIEDLVVKHVLDVVLSVQAPFPFYKKAVDVGSGGGIPGIILSILWEKSQVTLVERRQKKALCLDKLVHALKKQGEIQVLAEDLSQIRARFQVEDLWFRGFMPGAELAEFLSLLYPKGREGQLFLMKGPRWREEKEEILKSKKVSEVWKERIVRRSEEFQYVLPAGAGERVLVFV